MKIRYWRKWFVRHEPRRSTKTDYGQKLEEIGEVISRNLVKGKHSLRNFNPNKCGGKILKLSWKNTKFTKNGLNDIKIHLSRFESNKANQKMIMRIEKILEGKLKPSDYDKRFFSHEVREYERYKSLGVKDGVNDVEAWENCHAATLEDYQLYELDKNGGMNLYHPDVTDIDFITKP